MLVVLPVAQTCAISRKFYVTDPNVERSKNLKMHSIESPRFVGASVLLAVSAITNWQRCMHTAWWAETPAIKNSYPLTADFLHEEKSLSTLKA